MRLPRLRRSTSTEPSDFEERWREARTLLPRSTLYVAWPPAEWAKSRDIPADPEPGVPYVLWSDGTLDEEPTCDLRWPPRAIWTVASVTGLRFYVGTVATGRRYTAASFTVVSQVPTAAAFGPFGDAVLERLTALEALDVVDARRLAQWLSAHPVEIAPGDGSIWTFPSAEVPFSNRRSDLLGRCNALVGNILLAKAALDPALERGKHYVDDPDGDWRALHDCAVHMIWAAAAPDLLGPRIVDLYVAPWHDAIQALRPHQ